MLQLSKNDSFKLIMNQLLAKIKEKIPSECFTDTELATILEGSKHRRYGLVKRAIAHGDLISLRRGLYCLGSLHQQSSLDSLALSQRLYGPSYISFELALSHHGWIPEGVHVVTAACLKRSQQFKTPLGTFSYRHVSSKPFFAGVRTIPLEKGTIFMATPWTALADYIFFFHKKWKGLTPLLHSLRLDDAIFQQMNMEEFTEAEQAYKNHRVISFFAHLRKDLLL